ncbi:MAG: tetratricopeptide repeat protein [Myxococcales bacterium]|nr:tetratricopeptide repeat protein [Myxococcales bacterium]
MIRAVAALALAVATGACSAPPIPADLARGYERERAGDVDGALAAYAAAAARCERAPSRQPTDADCGRALLAHASLLAEHGQRDRAIAEYIAVADRAHGDPRPAAEGLFRAGRLAYDAARPAEAAGYLWAVVERYPDEAFAGDAVGYLVRRAQDDAPRALWDRLRVTYEALVDTDVADNLLWAMAGLAADQLGDPATAIALYDRLPIDHPTSGLRDDARWRAASLARAAGDPAGAVARLRALVATREVAFGAGSYFSVWLDDAQLLLARVLRDDLHDVAGAAAAFARLPRDYPRSILVDDALADLAALEEARGRTDAACAAAARLLAADAESRFAPDARARQARLGCPEARR